MVRNKLKKKKYGGPGTKVGNLLRKAGSVLQNAQQKTRNVANVAGAFSSPLNIPKAVGNIVANKIQTNKNNKLTQGLDFNNPIQKAINERNAVNREINRENMPDSGLFTQRKNEAGLNVYRAMGQNTGGSVAGASNFVSGNEETIDEFGRSTGMGGQPTVNTITTAKTAPTGGEETSPTPEFMRGGVSNVGSTTGAGAGAGAGLGNEAGGGTRQLNIPGTKIEDPVLKNLLEQYGKDAQLDVDLDEIRDRNRTNVQAEIDAINAVYSDLVGRAVRTGKEAEGSERALQARSGTLPSSFGQGAIQVQAENTNKNVGEIENQRTQAISEIYSRSEARAMDEFTKLQNLRTSGVEGYIQAMEIQKESMDKGLDETAQYIALSGMTGDDLGIDGLEKLAKDWNTTPMAVYNRIAEKKSLLDNSVIERAKAMKDAGMGTETNMGSDFDYFSKESIAMSVLPTQLRNSDKEQEYYRAGIKQGLEAGMDPYDIADVLMGFNVTNKDEFTSSVRQLIGQSELAPAKIADVARNINAGNYSNALSIVENSIMGRARKDLGDDFVSETFAKNSKQRADEIIKRIEDSQKSPIGVMSGTMEKWLGKLRGKEASKILADVTIATNQLRSKLAGSAVTDTELRYLENFIPALNDKPDVFMYKLQKLKSDPLLQLNNIRQQYGMIPLDEESLANKNIRVEDYYQVGATMPQQTMVSGGQTGGDISNWNWQF